MIPVSLTRTFGTMVGDRRQGLVLVAVMGVIWAAFLAVAAVTETHPNGPAALAAGAAMEGKEVRFGIPASALFAVSTTGTSTGAVNSLHDSYTGARARSRCSTCCSARSRPAGSAPGSTASSSSRSSRSSWPG